MWDGKKGGEEGKWAWPIAVFVPPPFVFALRLLFGRKAVPGVMTSGPSVWKGGPRPTEERKDGGGGCRCFRSARGGCGAAAGNDGGSRARAFLKGEAGERARAGIVYEREIQTHVRRRSQASASVARSSSTDKRHPSRLRLLLSRL